MNKSFDLSNPWCFKSFPFNIYIVALFIVRYDILSIISSVLLDIKDEGGMNLKSLILLKNIP